MMGGLHGQRGPRRPGPPDQSQRLGRGQVDDVTPDPVGAEVRGWRLQRDTGIRTQSLRAEGVKSLTPPLIMGQLCCFYCYTMTPLSRRCSPNVLSLRIVKYVVVSVSLQYGSGGYDP